MTYRKTQSDRAIRNPQDLDSLSFGAIGLIPVVAQDAASRAVLMVAYANREALERTLETRQLHFWSRSRSEIWHKGATSGHHMELVSLHADCDSDTLLALVHPLGPACHTGETTCFGELGLEIGGEGTLPSLWEVLQDRADRRPADSYTSRLLDDENLRVKKLGEETAELILALCRADRQRVAEEGADLVYHVLVALLASRVTLGDLLQELEARKK